ncbi:hypothetical protein EXIGLDRAFT_728123 [Exidia glandulosa HHB12029]|uniref:T6SS Phospholipase effector Tle1-like catalytic domain-containing protein n=1 Tax=Exidia glandulosa HHB12029 TaxID=1314781 RepID=A0A165LVN6_EXIGL|nr:hypothetical protein EXIGLDRAFT_728123 [Exidia glandulosa HHB12029]
MDPSEVQVDIDMSDEARAARRRANKTYKRLVVFCDGTGQQTDSPSDPPKKEAKVAGDDSVINWDDWVPASNITRMCRILADADVQPDGREIEQLSFYQNGVATGALGWVNSAWNGAFGVGVNENVCEAYVWLCMNWIPGDEIFLFGFSRGAFTARAVAGLIRNLGLLERASLGGLHSIYSMFEKRDEDDAHRKAWAEWADVNLQDSAGAARAPGQVDIKVVGVFDTVQSQGLPRTAWIENFGYNKKYTYHDTFISDNVENALQVLALDEFRPAFSPTLWFLPTNPSNKTVLRQTWFSGAHSDAGGVERLYTAFCREDQPMDTVEWIAAQPLHDSMTPTFKAAGRQARTPGAYRKMEGVRRPTGDVGPANERVHWSVRLRLLHAVHGHGVRTGQKMSGGWFGKGLKDEHGYPVWDVAHKFECEAMKGFAGDIELEEDPISEMDHKFISDDDVPLLFDVAKSAGLHFQ